MNWQRRWGHHAQALPGNIEKLDVTYCGELAEMQFDILTRTMLQAILNPILTEPVNLINAPTIAKKRGIMVTEARRSESDGYRSIIIATAASDKASSVLRRHTSRNPQ